MNLFGFISVKRERKGDQPPPSRRGAPSPRKNPDRAVMVCYNHEPPKVFSVARSLWFNPFKPLCPYCKRDNSLDNILTELSVEEYRTTLSCGKERATTGDPDLVSARKAPPSGRRPSGQEKGENRGGDRKYKRRGWLGFLPTQKKKRSPASPPGNPDRAVVICYNHEPPKVFSIAQSLKLNSCKHLCPYCNLDYGLELVLTDLSVEDYKKAYIS